jgi:signal transduction histidine kinase
VELEQHEVFFFTVVVVFVLILIIGFLMAGVMLYAKRQLQHKYEIMKRDQVFEEELQATLNELSEHLMRNISTEIHDNIGMSLSVAKLQLNVMNEENFTDKGTLARELISRSLRDLRNLSKALNGDYLLREGFMESLHREVELLNKADTIRCSINGHYEDGALDSKFEIILYRCVQEGLNNAIKHSGASRLEIQITKFANQMQISLIDDGVGFPDDWESKKGIGMDSMYKRVSLIGGKLKLDSRSGKGSTISITFPIQKEIEQ